MRTCVRNDPSALPSREGPSSCGWSASCRSTRSPSGSRSTRPRSGTGSRTCRTPRSSTATRRGGGGDGRLPRVKPRACQDSPRPRLSPGLVRVRAPGRRGGLSRLRLHVHRRGVQALPEHGGDRQLGSAGDPARRHWIRRFARNKVTYTFQYHADQDPEYLIRFWSSYLGVEPEPFRYQRKSNSGQLKGRNWRSRWGVLTVERRRHALRARACRAGSIASRRAG